MHDLLKVHHRKKAAISALVYLALELPSCWIEPVELLTYATYAPLNVAQCVRLHPVAMSFA